MKEYCKAEIQVIKTREYRRGFKDGSDLPSPSKGEWVSVEDRLPEVGSERYLILCKGGNRRLSYYWWNDGQRDVSDWQRVEGRGSVTDYGYEVTHWQPLPPPPESTQQEGAV